MRGGQSTTASQLQRSLQFLALLTGGSYPPAAHTSLRRSQRSTTLFYPVLCCESFQIICLLCSISVMKLPDWPSSVQSTSFLAALKVVFDAVHGAFAFESICIKSLILWMHFSSSQPFLRSYRSTTRDLRRAFCPRPEGSIAAISRFICSIRSSSVDKTISKLST